MSTYQPERFPFPSPGRLRRELRLQRAPRWLVWSLLALLVPSLVALALIYRARHTTSTQPRIHLIQDMGVQPRYNPQSASNLFADGAAARAPIAGTLARGQLEDREHYHRGYRIDQGEIVYFDGLPPEIANDARLLERGSRMYGIYCGTCHGDSGDGRGLINDLAIRNLEPKWVPAADLNSDLVRQQPDGQLYNTIRNGIKNMPAHGAQIDTPDRWAIVAYLRHLQQQAAGNGGPAAAANAHPETRNSQQGDAGVAPTGN